MSKNPVRKKSKKAIRNRTRKEVLKTLGTHGKCFLIRPTGYGKTYFLADMTSAYTRVLYLCPSVAIIKKVIGLLIKDKQKRTKTTLSQTEIDQITKTRAIDGVTLMTYQKLVSEFKKGTLIPDYDLIIMDEAHKIGGTQTRAAISWLMSANPSADFVGATATPNRSDSIDVVSSFFSGIMVSPYTLHNAFQDGLLQEPHYFCGVSDTDIKEDLKEAALTAGLDPKNPAIRAVLKRKAFEVSDLYNMDNVIHNACHKYLDNTSYMKYIVFFPTIEKMHGSLPEVKGWFQNAFPTHRVNTICVSSLNKREHDVNLEKVKSIRSKKNCIDLICCVDMLSEGEHFNNLTGIMMYRVTYSNIKFNQQLGRALSINNNNRAIVFDVVDNLHRKGIFDLPVLKSKKKRGPRKTSGPKPTTPWMIDDNGNVVDEYGNLAPYTMDEEGRIFDNKGNLTNMYVIPGTNLVTAPPAPQSKLQLNMLSHEAGYREIIAKSVAEPASQRARLALIIHFQAWCDANNIPYSGIEDMVKLLKAESQKPTAQQTFINSFINLLKSKNLSYPLHDLQLLTSYGTSANASQIPLAVCAKAKNVSVRTILEMILAGTSTATAQAASAAI